MSPVSAPNRHTGMMLDRYELLAQLGTGGMGSVHLARLGSDGGFERLFAIKLMHPHIAQQPEAASRVLDEARLAARIHHPNVVSIIDVRESAHGPYIVMDYVEGLPLSDVLHADVLQEEQRLRLGLRGIIDAATGLHAAHCLRDQSGAPLGLVHRDVSPHNILLGSDGSGRIIDFGVAHAAKRIVSTQGSMIKGKVAYLSPEQARAGEVDARSDVFALGLILWETLTGKILFDQDSAPSDIAIIMRLLHDPIPAPSTEAASVHPQLEEVCMRALSKAPEERFPSARDMVDALEHATQSAGLWTSPRASGDLFCSLFWDQLLARRELTKPRERSGGSAFAASDFALPDARKGSGTRSVERHAPLGERATEDVRGTPDTGRVIGSTRKRGGGDSGRVFQDFQEPAPVQVPFKPRERKQPRRSSPVGLWLLLGLAGLLVLGAGFAVFKLLSSGSADKSADTVAQPPTSAQSKPSADKSAPPPPSAAPTPAQADEWGTEAPSAPAAVAPAEPAPTAPVAAPEARPPAFPNPVFPSGQPVDPTAGQGRKHRDKDGRSGSDATPYTGTGRKAQPEIERNPYQ